MKKLLFAKKRRRTQSSTTKTLAYKATKKVEEKSITRKIDVKRVNNEAIHAMRIAFNEAHFGCKEFYHRYGKETWSVPVSKKEIPIVSIKRILQIIVPSSFYFVTDKTRKKIFVKRDDKMHIISREEKSKNITAHGENAVKEMLLKAGIDKDSIMTKRNVCYVTLHKQITEEKIKDLFPTLHIQIFKIRK